MELSYQGETVTVFTITPRTLDIDEYWHNIELCIEWSNDFGATGLLLFEGNDTYISPWVVAQAIFERSERLCPLVAVNPIYMHPFSVAKLVNSFAQLYGRRTYLNMITGTALSYLQAMNDELDHDQRYERLGEYVELVRDLLATAGPVTRSGHYYNVKNLKLEPPTPPDLMPEFFFAGGSDAATATKKLVDGVQMRMLPPGLEEAVIPGEAGIHFGIITRETQEGAWEAAGSVFPKDLRGERIQALTMRNTDSVWKQRMMKAAELESEAESGSGYWLMPFKSFRADCPYFVASRARVAELIAGLVRRGVRHIVLDLPCQRDEFENIGKAFDQARSLLA